MGKQETIDAINELEEVHDSMNDVFCIDCVYLKKDSHMIEICKKRKYSRKTFLRRLNADYQYCAQINYFNDCKDYERKVTNV